MSLEQLEKGVKGFTYVFYWGKLLGEKNLTEETPLDEVKKALDSEMQKNGFQMFTDQEFQSLALFLKLVKVVEFEREIKSLRYS